MKKILAVLLASIMLIGMIAACGGSDDPAPPAPQPSPDAPVDPVDPPVIDDTPIAPPPDVDVGETHLQVVQAMMPSTLDPTLNNEVPQSRANYLIFQTLVYLDGGKIVPGLATSWDFVDPQTLILQLREGVKFHNGNILTAEDVVFSINRASASSHVAAVTDMIDEAIALGDYEVQITTQFPFAPLLSHLTHTATSIVNKEEVERIGDDEHGLNPVGTGPFMFDNQVAGDRYELVRFDDFNSVVPGLPEGQLPAVERITFRVIPDPSVRTIELETGAAHVLLDVAATEVARIRDHSDLNMFEVPNFALNSWLGFNVQQDHFKDIRVRQAVAYALDIPSIVDVAWASLGMVATSPLPSTVPGYIEFPVIQQDIEKARELMEDAGFADGFTTDVWLNEGNAMRADAATMIQAQLRAINIDVTINIYEWATLLPATAAGEHEMSIMGWTTATGDADYGLYPLHHSENWGESGNRNFYSNARVDELLELGRSETDPDARIAIYQEAQKLIMEDMPMIPLWQAAELHATRSNVHGFVVTPNGNLPFWNVVIG
ncbi:MAG: ABC transporter substrate-binding protein [Oscillospiraceae bacterium]|jgi:peptide/nickel transport system substrate-binding protein|nr:ABC transporter substrate-binding protein [Oscillospiraceae bacterium]